MSNKKVREYFESFPEDAELSVVVANPRSRKKYETIEVMFITDMEHPVICIDVGNETDMDEDEIAVCEECEKQGE